MLTVTEIKNSLYSTLKMNISSSQQHSSTKADRWYKIEKDEFSYALLQNVMFASSLQIVFKENSI